MGKCGSILCVALVVFVSPFALAQNATYDSYTKAREVLERSIAAYGGIERLRAIENVTFRAEGDTVHRNQSRKPFAADRTPFNASYMIDAKNMRYRQSQDVWFPGGYHVVNGFAMNKTEGMNWNVQRASMTPLQNIPPANFRGRLRMFPQFIILNAADRRSVLRFIGTMEFDGRAHDVVSYANEDGLAISLYIDQKTSLLSKYETLGTDSYSGDVVNEVIFPGYRDQNGQLVPTGRVDKRSGDVMLDLKYLDVVYNAPLTDDDFKKLPDGIRPATPAPANPPSTMKYADNVYTVNVTPDYNSLVVGFKDYVFVMEAPNNDATSRRIIADIKKLLPDKPIRYLAVTHHHDDHGGGIRTYVAEAVTVIGLPGQKTFFETVMKSSFTINPDALTLKPQPMKWESIEGRKRVLTDGTTTVELIDIGPSPHAEEMLIAYLPNEKLVFQGDLLDRYDNQPIINDITVHFSNWLDQSKLDVARVLAVHGPPSTRDELRQGVAEKKKGVNPKIGSR
jgi:glyoxylase-like metal-dependent hydrolase (beta-lactamase superfamily II)